MADIKIVQKRNNSTEITISGELDIFCTTEFYQQHFHQIAIKDLLTLKLAGITEIDTAGIQILIMLIKIAQKQGSNYQVISISNALTEYSNIFQLNQYFITNKDNDAIPALGATT